MKWYVFEYTTEHGTHELLRTNNPVCYPRILSLIAQSGWRFTVRIEYT